MDSGNVNFFKMNISEFHGSQLPSRIIKEDLKKYFKLKLVLNMLKNIAQEGGDSNSSDRDSNERVVKSVKTFIAKNFLQNIGVPDYIQVAPDIHLSFTEQQIMKRCVVDQIKKTFSDTIDIIRTIKDEHPEFLNTNIMPEKVIIDLEINRQQLYRELVLVLQKKYKLLMNLIELRLSPQTEYEMRMILKEFEIIDVKVDVFYSHIHNHVMRQAPGAVTALKKIETVIDKKLKEKLQHKR